MALQEELLTEDQCCELAGITVDTIRQYRQFGLIHPVSDSEPVQYRAADVRSLFYVETESAVGRSADVKANTGSSSVPNPSVVTSPAIGEPQVSRIAEDKSIPSPAKEIQFTENALPPDHDAPRLITPSGQSTSGTTEATSGTTEDASLNTERQAIADITRSLREQIETLREERDWLRERVEKLENRSEREQMLLLSESDTVRRLIQQQKKRTLWNFALPWFRDAGNSK